MSDKYYFVCFDAVLYKELPKEGFGDGELDIEGIPGMMEVNKRKVIPLTIPAHGIMYSKNGMFVPFEVESYFKFFCKCDAIFIKFVRECTKEEFEMDLKLRQQKDTPQPLDYNTQQEIEKLLSSAESGSLKVHVDPDSEKVKDEFEDLYKSPFDDE